MLSAAQIDVPRAHAALTTTRFAGRLHHFPTISSTNTALLAQAATLPENTVFVADEQTAGRGRSGHTWHSTAGDGIYVSALVRPQLPLARALWLSLATGLAAQSAIAQTAALTPDIRWPNDLLLGSKKLGGILVETAIHAAAPDTLRHAVIGIGLNVSHAAFPAGLAPLATSLQLATGHSISRTALLIALLRALDLELTRLESDPSTLLARFTAASTWVFGKPVHVSEEDGYTGVTHGLDSAGFLTVLAADGSTRTVRSGGVRSAAHPL